MAALMKEFSEDPGSKDNGRVYPVAPDAPMVEPFKNLVAAPQGRRGRPREVAVRLARHQARRRRRRRDALESADILKREPVTAEGEGQAHPPRLEGQQRRRRRSARQEARSRALEKLVKETVAKLKKGEKIEPLMKELSEDPGSAKTGEGYDVTPDAGLVEPFKNLSLRLKVGEVGVVKTQFGIHIIQRTE